jgi:hypothetical protein
MGGRLRWLDGHGRGEAKATPLGRAKSPPSSGRKNGPGDRNRRSGAPGGVRVDRKTRAALPSAELLGAFRRSAPLILRGAAPPSPLFEGSGKKDDGVARAATTGPAELCVMLRCEHRRQVYAACAGLAACEPRSMAASFEARRSRGSHLRMTTRSGCLKIESGRNARFRVNGKPGFTLAGAAWRASRTPGKAKYSPGAW